MERRSFIKSILAATGCIAFGALPKRLEQENPEVAVGLASFGLRPDTYEPYSAGMWTKLPTEGAKWHHVMVFVDRRGPPKVFMDGEPMATHAKRKFNAVVNMCHNTLQSLREKTEISRSPKKTTVRFPEPIFVRKAPEDGELV